MCSRTSYMVSCVWSGWLGSHDAYNLFSCALLQPSVLPLVPNRISPSRPVPTMRCRGANPSARAPWCRVGVGPSTWRQDVFMCWRVCLFSFLVPADLSAHELPQRTLCAVGNVRVLIVCRKTRKFLRNFHVPCADCWLLSVFAY